MTTRPRLVDNVNLLQGFAAVALFAVMGWVFAFSEFAGPQGFGDGSITASIGYAMFDMLDQSFYQTESFLVAFEIIDIVLVAALVGAVMLARREDDTSTVTALADGGRRVLGRDTTDADGDSDGGED